MYYERPIEINVGMGLDTIRKVEQMILRRSEAKDWEYNYIAKKAEIKLKKRNEKS